MGNAPAHFVMPPVLNDNLDYIAFGTCALLLFGALAVGLPRIRAGARLPLSTWPIVAITLIVGGFLIGYAGREERVKIEGSLKAMVPTYALEMQRLGHAKVSLEARDDDPLYRQLLQAEREWMQVNPLAHDIYTVRKRADGKNVFVVDSETDYDRNGKIEGEREQRRPLGELYEEEDPCLERALLGEANFDPEVVTDRWGKWVGAWAPIYGAAGKVEAVVGVDFDAGKWLAEIAGARRGTLLELGLFLATIAAAMTAIGVLKANLAHQLAIERKVRKSEERWRHIIEQMPLAFIERDTDSRIIGWNPAAARIFGWAEKEVLGCNGIDFLVAPAARAQVAAIWKSLSQAGAERHSVNENLTKDGRVITCEWFNSQVVDDQGKVRGAISLGQDVSLRLHLDQQAQQSQKLQSVGLLAAGVAHDFNNILTIILGHTDLLLSRIDLPAEAAADIESVAVAADRAADLTRQLLSFSRKRAMFARPIDLNTVVEGSVTLLARTLGADIALDCDLAASLPAVEADPSMLDQVITNLAVNARDAMPRGGALALSTRLVEIGPADVTMHPEARPGLAVCLRISDSGSGMPPDQLQRIFEPFFTTKEPGKGTGLGLAAVHGIVKQHRGWIEVASEVGKGTMFEIYLPASSAPAAAPERRPAPSQRILLPPTERVTILLVEDEPTVRKIARTALERGGFAVLEAPDGPSAEKLFATYQERIALLCTDMVMPNGLGGRELAQRCLARNPKLRVVFASGYSVETAAPDFRDSATQIFLQKPYLPVDLTETVRRCLGMPALHAAKK